MIGVSILCTIAAYLCGLASMAGAIALLVADRSVLLPWVSWQNVAALFVACIAGHFLARVFIEGAR